MSLPRKGIRLVKVMDTEYEWTIRKKPTYMQGAFRCSMNLAVQSACKEGRTVLIVNLGVSRPDNWINPHQTMITPAVVRKIINAAINDGWNPNGGGKTFYYKYQIVKV
ncbi:MAG TPA: hypothetical protein VF941_17155 [Clostridia bacterium]